MKAICCVTFCFQNVAYILTLAVVISVQIFNFLPNRAFQI